MSRHYDYEHLVVVKIYGDVKVGKTTLVEHFVSGKFNQDVRRSIGMDFATRQVVLDNISTKVRIFDASGNERFHATLAHFAYGAHVLMFAYDVTNYSTFKNIKHWHELILSRYTDSSISPTTVLVGTKCDDSLNRIVTFEEASQLARSLGIKHTVEVSAKDGINVEEAFVTGIADYLAMNKSNNDNSKVKIKTKTTRN